MNKKITLPELVDSIAAATGLPKKNCESFIKDLTAVLEDSLLRGENVKIAGFGTFKSTEVEARKSVDVNTGEEIEIPSYKKISLTVDKALAAAVNSAFAEFETVELPDSVTEEDLAAASTATPLPEPVPEPEAEVEAEEENHVEIQAEPELVAETGNESAQEAEEIAASAIYEETEDADVPKTPIDKIRDFAFTPQETEDTPTEQYATTDEQETITEHHSQFRHGILWGALAGVAITLFVIAGVYTYVEYRLTRLNEYEAVAQPAIAEVVATETIDTLPESEATVETQPLAEITDTIGTTRFLTTMARKYYGNFNFWVYIYDYNKDIITNPNRIAPGTVVKIPAAEKYGINKDDPQSVTRAQALAAEIKERFD